MRYAKRPGDLPAVRAERFRESAEAVIETYTDEAVLLLQDGEVLRGEDLQAAMRRIVGLNVPPVTNVRHALVSGDTALLIVDWESHGTAPDGSPVAFAATATDVVRLCPDGNWRYVIDYPFGGRPADAE
jgi:ketosteroid isomerase-like protein